MSRSVTPGRYVDQPDGTVYDTRGRYYIDRDLWERRLREGRSDRADHDFVLGEALVEQGIPGQWHRVRATCRICGERRAVYHDVPMRMLNSEWCIPQSWWRRLSGRRPW